MGGIILIALWALVPGFIARNKGRSFGAYYFLSFLITPLITMIITICLKDNQITGFNTSKKQCPNCGTEYNYYESVCHKCRTPLKPLE